LTVISRKLCDRVTGKGGYPRRGKRDPHASHLIAANKTSLKRYGNVEVDFRINGLVIPFSVAVVDQLNHDCIIGVDFLRKTMAKIDMHCNTLELFDGLSVTPMIKPEGAMAFTLSTVTIPPKSETLFPIGTKKSFDMDVLLEGGCAPCNTLMIARTLLNPRKLMCCRALNPTDKAIILRPRTPVGRISPVTAVQQQIATPPPPHGKLPSIADMRSALEAKGVCFDNTAVTGPDLDRLITQLFINQDIMATSLLELPGTHVMYHHIDTAGAEPVRQRGYRYSPQDKAEISRQTKEMLDAGIIEPYDSPWCSRIVLTKKKDGTQRFCVDYREVNARSKIISYPLPTLEEVFDNIAEAKPKLFTSLDLFSGYWQAILDPESAEKTGFQTHEGAFIFRRLPFGISSAPVWFQKLMNTVLKLPTSTVLIYLDDLLVLGASPGDMENKLQQIFDRFRAANLRIKPSKCSWSVGQVTFLGHKFDENGVSVLEDKVRVIKQYPRPNTVKRVKSFLGLVGYYRRFIFRFSQITAPLRKLLKKDTKFCWSDECEAAFAKLKEALCTAPVLALPDLNRPYILTTDASTTGIAYILSQLDDEGREHVISYGGRSLHDNETKWCITELECLAIIQGCKEYMVYLKGQPFTVATDHVSLSYLKKMKLSGTGRLVRWALFLQQFRFEVSYRRGSTLGSADAISRMFEQTREKKPAPDHDLGTPSLSDDLLVDTIINDRSLAARPHTAANPDTHASRLTERVMLSFDSQDGPTSAHISALTNTTSDLPSIKDVAAALPSCPDFCHIFAYLSSGILPDDERLARRTVHEADDYILEDGLLFHLFTPRTKNLDRLSAVIKQLCIPTNLRPALAKALHDSNCHLGFSRLYVTARTRYFFPGMYVFLRDHVKTCLVCQQVKRPPTHQPVPIVNMPVHPPLTYWVIDFHGPFSPSPPIGHTLDSCCAPNKYILTVVDSSSMWPELIAVPDCSAETVCQSLFDCIVSRMGVPQGMSLQSDCGSAFISKLCASWTKLLGIKQYFSTPYHPSPNARAENMGETIHKSLKVLCSKHTTWSKHLQSVALAYRASATSNTHLSPHEVVFGRPMQLPIDYSLHTGNDNAIHNYMSDIRTKLDIYGQIAMQNVADSAQQHSKKHNSDAVHPKFKKGDKVLLHDPTTHKTECAKLKIRWIGPYLISDVLDNFNYRLVHLESGKNIRRPVHASRLRLVVEMDNDYRLSPTGNDVTTYSNGIVKITVGNLLHMDVNAIVNPTNAYLNYSDEVTAAITSQAGPDLDHEFTMIQAMREKLDMGEAIVTPAYDLSPKINKIIHVCCPHACDVLDPIDSTVKLRLAYSNAIQQAIDLDTVESIAIPVFSVGVTDIGPWASAQAAAEAVASLNDQIIASNLRLIVFVSPMLYIADVFATVFRLLLGQRDDVRPSVDISVPPSHGDPSSSPPAQLPGSSSNWYPIEAILKHKRSRNQTLYLVKWKDTDKTSWVKRRDLTDAAIQAYYASKPQTRRRRRRRY
jgi:O-acetyl-ADP-ribose deacetylase (regulator of RNase III)